MIARESQALLHAMQKDSFDYFVNEVNPLNGLIRDKTADDWPASIAAVGMALTVYAIGVERGCMARADAVGRTLTTLRFFANSEQSDAPTATGYKGFYYHFLDMDSGARALDCELSSIDTALLIAGVLTAPATIRRHAGRTRDPRTGRHAVPARGLAMDARPQAADVPRLEAGEGLSCAGIGKAMTRR
jgi:hypothetical protein